MKYIEERYTEPNKDGVIGCIFIPQTEPETAPAETEPESAEPEKQEKPKKK